MLENISLIYYFFLLFISFILLRYLPAKRKIEIKDRKPLTAALLFMALSVILALLAIIFSLAWLFFISALLALTGIAQYSSMIFKWMKATQHKKIKGEAGWLIFILLLWILAFVLFVLHFINLF